MHFPISYAEDSLPRSESLIPDTGSRRFLEPLRRAMSLGSLTGDGKALERENKLLKLR